MPISLKKSDQLFEQASKFTPMGTQSRARIGFTTNNYEGLPIRYPRVFERGEGSHLFDVDGNEYIDYHLGFGPVLLGHCHPRISEAVKEQVDRAVILGAEHEVSVRLCEKMTEHIPCADQVLLSVTGSEAVSTAIKVARAYSGKEKIVRFWGHYHGWHGEIDRTPISIPAANLNLHGFPKNVIDNVIVLPWNNLEIVETVLRRQGHEIAAVITEAYEANSGWIAPEKGYLEGLRQLTKEQGIVLIFDEVITGFRMGLGGAQEILGVTPDMATFGKAMANGFPISAVVGKKEVFEPLLEGRGGTAGTYNSQSVCVAAAMATITELENKENYDHLYKTCKGLMKGLRDAIEDVDVEAIVQGPADKHPTGPGFSLWFTDLEKITDGRQAEAIPENPATAPHVRRQVTFWQEMVNKGVLICPYRGGRIYMCIAHEDKDVDKTIEAAEVAFKKAKESASVKNNSIQRARGKIK